MTKSIAFLSLSLSALVGCAADEPKKPVVVAPDAGGGGGGGADAPQQATCAVESAVGTSALTQSAGRFVDDPMDADMAADLIYGLGPLNADPKPDFLLLDMYKGYTVFMNGFPAGATTIQLTGDETNFALCGACVRIGGDVDTQAGTITAQYMASGGTLQLDKISETQLKGSLTNVQFTHVDIAQDGTTTPNSSGCTSQLANLAFDIVVEPEQAKMGTIAIPVDLGKMTRRYQAE